MVEVSLTEEQHKMYNVAAHVWCVFYRFVVYFHFQSSSSTDFCRWKTSHIMGHSALCTIYVYWLCFLYQRYFLLFECCILDASHLYLKLFLFLLHCAYNFFLCPCAAFGTINDDDNDKRCISSPLVQSVAALVCKNWKCLGISQFLAHIACFYHKPFTVTCIYY